MDMLTEGCGEARGVLQGSCRSHEFHGDSLASVSFLEMRVSSKILGMHSWNTSDELYWT